MRRRGILTAAGGAVAFAPARARSQAGRPRRVAIITPGADAARPVFAAFREAMRALGHVDGGDVAIELHLASGDVERLAALARELVAAEVAVIVADGGAAVDAARAATARIPIVGIMGGDPVQRGLVASLARPGANLTGVTIYSLDLGPKQVELMRELRPDARRLLLFAGLPDVVREGVAAARQLGFDTVEVPARAPAEIERALTPAALAGFDGVIVMPSPETASHRVAVVSHINAWGGPAVYPDRDFASAGGLVSYGIDISDVYRRLARTVDRILRGANPAELPVERPERIELMVNLRTARALAIAIPVSILARADEVIE